jgi:hypothetical protein
MAALNTLKFSDFGLESRIPRRPAEQKQDSWDSLYDDNTYIYDFLWVAGKIVAIAPPLDDVQRQFFLENLLIDGVPAKELNYLHFRHERLEKMVVSCDPGRNFIGTSPPIVTFAGCSIVPTLPLSLPGNPTRLLYTMQKDMPLRWIKDWIEYHVRAQGAEAVVIYDNGSMTYDAMSITQYTQSIGVPIVVQNFDFKYGPTAYKGSRWDSDYCQYAGLEHFRYRASCSSCKVLSVDIDELVVSKKNSSVFEALEEAACTNEIEISCLLFSGVWVYTSSSLQLQAGSLAAHDDHFLVLNSDSLCPSKLVYSSKHLDDSIFVGVHNLFNDKAKISESAYFLHHRSITQGWFRNGSSVSECDARAKAIPRENSLAATVDQVYSFLHEHVKGT